MRVHVLQHVWFEDIGSMAPWFEARGARLGHTRFHEPDAALPDVRSLDLLIAMGGPMSVNDEAQYPWLRAEKRFIAEAIRRGTPVVGVCLGAQLIASALGARVHANPVKEIGWFPIEAIDDGGAGADLFRFPPRITVFHWHGETFELPPGAVHLARSAACAHQAFQLGRSVIGMQFHLETTPESADLLIRQCRHELVDAPTIQTAEAMQTAPADDYAAINALMGEVLYHVTR